MKRLVVIVLMAAVGVTACGGDPAPVAERDGIPALEDSGDRSQPERERGKAPRDGSTGTQGQGRRPRSSARPAAEKKPPRRAPGGAADGTGAAEPGPAAAPAAASPLSPGRYEYRTDGYRTLSGNRYRLPRVTTLTAHAPTGGRQRQVRDLRDEDGNGTVTETDILYRPEGIFLAYVRVTSTFPGGLTDVREFEPRSPPLIAPTGAAPGFATSFAMRGSGTRADVAVAALRRERVNVGGRRLPALVVRTSITFSGALEGEQTSLSWFWPKNALGLREEVSTDVTNGPVRLQGEYTAVLTRLP